MDLALNNLQMLTCHKTQQTKPNLFRVRHQPPTQFTPMAVQPHILSGSLLRQMMIVTSFLCGLKTIQSDYAPEIRDTE